MGDQRQRDLLRRSGSTTSARPTEGTSTTGVAGVNGGIVVTFFELIGLPGDPRNDELEERRDRGLSCPPTRRCWQRIRANPEAFYVNLHNTRFPGGAARGQLED